MLLVFTPKKGVPTIHGKQITSICNRLRQKIFYFYFEKNAISQVIVLIFCMQNAYAQGPYTCFNSQQGVLSRAPKSWFNYIRTVLHLSHKKQGLRQENYWKVSIPDIWKSLTSRLESFINYSQITYGEGDMDNNIAEAREKFGNECANPINCYCWIKFHKNNTKASSQFEVFHVLKRPGFLLVKNLRVKTGIKYTWTFHLQPTLRLHIKFWEIHFLGSDENPCYGGNVTHGNFPLTFRGVHAQVSVFSQSSSAYLLLLSSIHTYYKVHFLQHVLDEDLIHSFTLIPNISIEVEPGLICPQVSLFLIIFRIKVRKSERITLKVDKNISLHKYMIYDGPGPEAEKFFGYIFEGATFQLTIQVCGNILHSSSDVASNRSNFNYKSKSLIQTKNFSINTDEILRIKSSVCRNRMIPVVVNVFGFHASENHHVNVTIADYFYEGLDSAGCT